MPKQSARNPHVPETARKSPAKKPPVAESSLQAAQPQGADALARLGLEGEMLQRLRPGDVLQLQRTAGNRAVAAALGVQAKLTVGPANDHYEQEADRVARQVLSMPAPAAEKTSVPAVQAGGLQREAAPEEEELQMKAAQPSIQPAPVTITRLQRQEEEELQMMRIQRQEEEEELQMKPIQRQEDEEELQMKSIQRQEDEEELQMKPIQRQEDEEELQMKPIQRQEDEEELQMKPIQRQEDEEELQMKPVQRQEEEEEVQTARLQRQEDEEEIQTDRLQRQEEEEEVQTARLQRQEEEEELQMKSIQRQEEEEELQTSRPAPARDGSFPTTAGFESSLSAARTGGQPLPASLRADLEPRFGADFSGVRVHTGADSATLNRQIQAHAFTHGSDIFFGDGAYDPGSQRGKELLAHELTHTIQQGATRQGSLQRAVSHAGRALKDGGTIQRDWFTDTSQHWEQLNQARRDRHNAMDYRKNMQEQGIGLLDFSHEGARHGFAKRAIQEGGHLTGEVMHTLGSGTKHATEATWKKVGGLGDKASTWGTNKLAAEKAAAAGETGFKKAGHYIKGYGAKALGGLGYLGAKTLGGLTAGTVGLAGGAATATAGAVGGAATLAAGAGGGLMTLGGSLVSGVRGGWEGTKQGAKNLKSGVEGTAALTKAATTGAWEKVGGLGDKAATWGTNALAAEKAAAAGATGAKKAGHYIKGYGKKALGGLGYLGGKALGGLSALGTGAVTGASTALSAVTGTVGILGSAVRGAGVGMLAGVGDKSAEKEQAGPLVDTSGGGVTLAEAIKNPAGNPSMLSGTAGASLGMLGGLTGLGEASKGMGEASADMLGGAQTGDTQRGIEGAGSMIENLGSQTSSGIGIATGIASAMQYAGAGGNALTSVAGTLGGTVLPVAGIVTGGVGSVKNIYQIGKAVKQHKKLKQMATGGGALENVAKYAAETSAKRGKRAGVNLVSNTLTAAGGIATVSGAAAPVGAGLALGGAAVKLGAFGVRKGKQALRDWRAKENPAAQTGQSYKDWAEAEKQRGWKGKLNAAVTMNWDKTTAKKAQQLGDMTTQLVGAITGPAGADKDQALEIFANIGATKADLTETDPAKLQKRIAELFAKRE